MNTETDVNAKGLMFYMENHCMKPLDLKLVKDEKVKQALEKIQSIDIDLKSKFVHWGVCIDCLDTVSMKSDFSIIFFREDKLDNAVWVGRQNSVKFHDFKEWRVSGMVNLYVRMYNTVTRKFDQKM